MTSILSAKHFHDETAAFEFLEARVWPKGPVCPHCGGVERISKMQGKSTPVGSYKCYQCRSKFTVKVGTVFESSHVKLHIWLSAPTSFTVPWASLSKLLGSSAIASAKPCATAS
jgi:transposase-like protein